MTAETVCQTLSATPLTYHDEDSLQASIEEALTRAGLPAVREVRLPGSLGRIDLMSGTVGIEVKIGGAWSTAVRQLIRYANADEITELVLVTNRASHSYLPPLMNGKPAHLVSLIEGGL